MIIIFIFRNNLNLNDFNLDFDNLMNFAHPRTSNFINHHKYFYFNVIYVSAYLLLFFEFPFSRSQLSLLSQSLHQNHQQINYHSQKHFYYHLT